MSLPIDRIPEPQNRRNAVAMISLPNSPVFHTNNNEEIDYPALGFPMGIASFTKGLNHNNFGELSNPADFTQFLTAVQNSLSDVPNYGNSLSFFENIPILAGDDRRPWINPVAGLSYDSEGLDAFNRTILPAPRIDSLNGVAEMVELYWMYLMRDINFTDYDEENIAQDAVDDLKNNFGSYNFIKGWTRDSTLIPLSVKTLFRGTNLGDDVGPYISQFMYRGNKNASLRSDERDDDIDEEDGYVKYGAATIDQRIVPAKQDLDFMTDEKSWLEVQNGLDTFRPGDRLIPKGKKYFDDERRFIRNLRDLTTFVHFDQLYQAYLTAAFYMLTERDISWAEGAQMANVRFQFDDLNPYIPPPMNIMKQEGFVNFGPPHILTLIPEVATRALKAIWFQKWFVHRRLRPEAFGGLIHYHKKSNNTKYPFIHASIFNNSTVLERIGKRNKEMNSELENGNPDKDKKTYLLGQAFKEGSPMHPSYGSGHATVAGACVTVLKAWFKEGPMPGKILESKGNGKGLKKYEGNDIDDITIHGELNKLASNISMGRNAAGVHYRSDYASSLILGEEVAISILNELKSYLPEPHLNITQPIFRFNRFFTNAPMSI